MTDTTDTPTDIDADEAAEKIEEAGIADESAAYTKAMSDEGVKTASDESEAHPS